MKVLINAQELPEGMGWDVKEVAKDASLADYLVAVDDFFKLNKWSARRFDLKEKYQFGYERCYGCSGCCCERIPLTTWDAMSLAAAGKSLKESSKLSLTIKDLLPVLGQFAELKVSGPIADIYLKRDEQGWCQLFNHEHNTCSAHDFRPLVCRTFFCSLISRRAEKLRQRIINGGEDDLIRRLIEWTNMNTSEHAMPWMNSLRNLRSGNYRSEPWGTPELDENYLNRVQIFSFAAGLNLARNQG